jgi:hypothetical protein
VLSTADVSAIQAGFAIYDHEWRAYAPVLGEPYRIDDYLLYFDGTILYLCAYALGNPARVLTAGRLADLIGRVAVSPAPEAVVIWGRFEPLASINPTGVTYPLASVMQINYDDSAVDTLIDFAAPNAQRERMRDRARRNALTTTVRQYRELSAQHLRLITEWAANHDLSSFHAAFATGVAFYVRDPRVYIVEASREEELVGFAVISLVSANRAVFLQNYNLRCPGFAVGDAVYGAMLDFVSEKHVQYLHLGYSATPGLMRFKRKWGGNFDLPPYREAGYSNRASLRTAITAHRADWAQRVIETAATTTVES